MERNQGHIAAVQRCCGCRGAEYLQRGNEADGVRRQGLRIHANHTPNKNSDDRNSARRGVQTESRRWRAAARANRSQGDGLLQHGNAGEGINELNSYGNRRQAEIGRTHCGLITHANRYGSACQINRGRAGGDLLSR